jgi:hypothetical protein
MQLPAFCGNNPSQLGFSRDYSVLNLKDLRVSCLRERSGAGYLQPGAAEKHAAPPSYRNSVFGLIGPSLKYAPQEGKGNRQSGSRWDTRIAMGREAATDAGDNQNP